ncbi:hypothetical protein [Sphingobacterium sp. UBA2074]|uniref:hypothetical protein n=1 Tax=Sphingobacterium sp. UBA2074 TaxID=1947487 RepID=UPI00257E5DF5|nr:hypothetical protein [Sphingobacterium sp. UBA2074]
MKLDDGTNVRKGGIDADGTLVIIKPDTESGRASAKKREDLLDKNNQTKHRTILYHPAIRIVKKGRINIWGLKRKTRIIHENNKSKIDVKS